MVSLDNQFTTFWEGLNLESVQILVQLMTDKSTADKHLLKRRFNERARGFEAVLKYLEGMGALKVVGRHVYVDKGLSPMKDALRLGKEDFFKSGFLWCQRCGGLLLQTRLESPE